MMPALFSGVSGLRNHEFRMNAIGNNLANVNTVGYKFSRVSFSDLVYQTIRDASAPQSVGGANPVQMGLGSLVNSVDVVNTQGNLESTGRPTDMSIQGDGFFVLNNGAQNKYTRAGVMVLGPTGYLQNPSDGMSYMGWVSVNGAVDTSVPVAPMRIPVGEPQPAQSTSQMSFTGNLDASGTVARGTIADGHALMARAAGTTLATALRSQAGTAVGLSSGDVIQITGRVGGTSIAGATLTVNGATTLADIAAAVQAALRSVADGDATENAVVTADGAIRVTSDGANDIDNLQLSVSGNTIVNGAFSFPSSIAGGGVSDESSELRRAAEGTDAMIDLFDGNGTSLGLSVGDDITLISSTSRGTALLNAAVLTNINAGTTYNQYRDGLRSALFSGAPASGEDVVIQADGSLRITSAEGADNGVSGLVLGAGPSAGDDLNSAFTAAQSFTEIQEAVDATTYRTSTRIFDSLGNPLNVDFTFTKSVVNSWEWTATYEGATVGSGVMNFDGNGELATPVGTLNIPLSNGATSPLHIRADFSNASQYSGSSSIVLNDQDGYASATLESFSIGQSGDIVGVFTNGRNVTLGQLAIATFRNPSGLLRNGRNLSVESPNSGTAILGEAGVNGRGVIVSGTLEMSNVDVAREFTDMIVTQRGFQANSRVITTSDQLLEELVNLKR